jgi:hypothetical protein
MIDIKLVEQGACGGFAYRPGLQPVSDFAETFGAFRPFRNGTTRDVIAQTATAVHRPRIAQLRTIAECLSRIESESRKLFVLIRAKGARSAAARAE